MTENLEKPVPVRKSIMNLESDPPVAGKPASPVAGKSLSPEYYREQSEMYRRLWEESLRKPPSPYARPQIGTQEEKDLVDARNAAVSDNDAERVRELDKKIDTLRGNAPQAFGPRPKRTPVVDRDILRTQKRPGYRYRWVNDDEDRRRIQTFLDAGYGFVADPVKIAADKEAGRPSSISSNVCRMVGGGMMAYLMEIPDEFHEADQKKKQQKVDESEQAITDNVKKVEGRYGNVVISR